MPLYRNFRKVTALEWIDEDHFVGTVARVSPVDDAIISVYAAYGWTKTGKNFFVYRIEDGHIEKLGSIPKGEIINV